MSIFLLKHKDDVLSYIIGVGLVLFAFNYVLGGISIGLVCIIISLIYILSDKEYRSRITFGSRYIYIPIFIICLSIIISGVYQYYLDNDFGSLYARVVIAVLFFFVYLAGRMFGRKLFKPFLWAVIIESVSTIIYTFTMDIPNGGLVAPYNRNLAIGLLIFGTVVTVYYKQWILSGVALIGMFFTASEEAMFVLAILFMFILIRRDISKKILFPIGMVLIVTLLGLFPFNYTKKMYAIPIEQVSMILFNQHNEEVSENAITMNPNLESVDNFYNKWDYILDGRINTFVEATDKWQWLGSGYVLNPIDKIHKPIYTVPITVAQQVGIWAGIAWLFVILYCLVKTKWKYAFIAVLALGIFDNFTWCQLGIWVFALIGIASLNDLKTDLIFKNESKTV